MIQMVAKACEFEMVFLYTGMKHAGHEFGILTPPPFEVLVEAVYLRQDLRARMKD